ncbi:hypothetical protein Q4Q34_07795 [Flavivirga abyssicola]|uniref:hypothetical protein n=1 Tax=Flavivirga abyssicola TaxID=3063533 RepID=UPI0026E01853|nr:hypothetical protein [Flavivirga sp. MEBiC07777]WVK14928.1 hypothetical protein Q4Q34_07795 [Flavivirga sp. MEBiC07777]
MKKTAIILSLILSHLSFSQITHPGVTSTASAAGDHAFVGTKSDGVFSNWLNTGYSATAYNLLGFTNQHAGFGIADGNNIVSPMVWMYANDRNAFRVRTINFNTDITSGTDLFTVRANGNIGIGTTNPLAKLDISGNFVFKTGTTSDNHSMTTYDNSGTARAYLAFTTGRTQFSLSNISGQEVFNLNTGSLGVDNVYIHMPKADSRFVISGYGDYKPEHKFIIRNGSALIEGDMFSTGNIGIGTTDTIGYKLAVNGTIRAKEIKVETGWADFVFENTYNLPTLKDVEQHIKEKGHLKDIPSAKEVAENGIFLGEMDSKLLQKIEELTLYTIQQEKKIEKLEKENQGLKSLSERLTEIEKLLESPK